MTNKAELFTLEEHKHLAANLIEMEKRGWDCHRILGTKRGYRDEQRDMAGIVTDIQRLRAFLDSQLCNSAAKDVEHIYYPSEPRQRE